ncbi:MAG: helix-turn-helix transcriptional regulator [Bacteroidales bacterium]|nr:helix-turn-helix transcriptional regulator [Bacteroidales bacterium]
MIKRFKSLLEQLHLSPSEFADRIGVQRSSVSHVLSGRNKPSLDFLEKILNLFPDIDAVWLITGRNSPQKDLTQGDSNAVNDLIQLQNAPIVNAENKKPLAHADEEPVDHIIIVYKNNTFRILKSSEK